MVNKIKLLLSLLLVVALVSTGCKKQEENPVSGNTGGGNTQTGAGTMSCKIDGENWEATQVPGSPYPAAYAVYGSQGGTAYLGIIGTQLSGNTASTVSINLYNVQGTGDYDLGVIGTKYGIASIGYSGGQGFSTGIGSSAIGKVTITKLDLTNKIASGTFNFTAVGMTGGATGTKNVTEGKFDVKWQ